MKVILYLLVSIFSIQTAYSQNSGLSKNDEKSIKQMINYFKKYSIHKDSIDWDSFEKKVWNSATISKDSAVITALTLNGEKHTNYFDNTSKSYIVGESNSTHTYEKIKPVKIPENLGYLSIKTFINSRKNQKATLEKGKNYILQNIADIKSQDSKELKGWVIDLRENRGGNMWPMLISLTPFLKSDEIGYFSKNGKLTKWNKRNGQIFNGSSNQTKKFMEEPISYHLKNDNLKIAVLISRYTASSGEATAISLMSNPNVRFIGTKSAGYTTSNKSFSLKNGDVLILTSGVMTDYTKKEYWKGITPQYEISNEADLEMELSKWFE